MNMMSTSFKSAVWILERNAVFMSFQPMIQRQKIHRRPGGLHPYAEVGVILEGKMEVNLDGTVYLLGPGDSIYIKPNLYHTMRNAGDTPCRSFWHLQIMDDSV
mgnify:CR=1 FL=1